MEIFILTFYFSLPCKCIHILQRTVNHKFNEISWNMHKRQTNTNLFKLADGLLKHFEQNIK